MRNFVFSAFIAIAITGCAPGLGSTLDLPELPEASPSDVDTLSGDELKVRVGKFIDSRPTDALAEINGRAVQTQGQVGPVVQDGFTRYYTSAGAKIVQFGAPTVLGEVLEWRTIVTPQFPSSNVVAKAKFALELRSSDERVLYRANYSGEASASNPMMSESDIQGILAEAMASAVREAVNDSSLLTRIRRASGPL